MKKIKNFGCIKIASVICFLSFIILSNSSCRKSSIEPRIIRDTTYFFSLNMNNRTHTTYSWISATTPRSADTPYAFISHAIDATGQSLWSLGISVDPEWYDIYRRGHSTIAIIVTLKKTGDLLGDYTIDVVNNVQNLVMESKVYVIPTHDAVFTVNYISPPGTELPVVEGTFRCIVTESITKTSFPATGSFRLRVRV